ncbi:MAG: DUF5777 family beta-barrel protein [Vicingaceae bacterium]
MMQLKALVLVLLGLLFSREALKAQDDLMNLFEEESEGIKYSSAAFKSSRVILGQSIENPSPGNLVFLIQHQFGNLNGGANELWGLDQAVIRLGFDYGVNEWLALGIGRSSYNKTFDTYAKVKLLRQSSGSRNMPVSLSLFSGAYLNSSTWEDPARENYFSSRMSYAHQLLIARKFNSNLTLQVSPTLIHRNLVATSVEDHDVLAISGGGRMKFNKWMSFNAEYFYLLSSYTAENFNNTLSLGIDMETGGHVFQIYVSNGRGMQEPYFVAENRGEWGNGDVFLAFNIHRTFVIRKPKTFRE